MNDKGFTIVETSECGNCIPEEEVCDYIESCLDREKELIDGIAFAMEEIGKRETCYGNCDKYRNTKIACRACPIEKLRKIMEGKKPKVSAIEAMAKRMMNGKLEMAPVGAKGLVVLSKEQLEDYQKCIMILSEIAKVGTNPMDFAGECMVSVENCRKIASGEIKKTQS